MDSSDSSSSTNSAPERRGWKQAIRGNVLMMGLVSLFQDFSSDMVNPLLPILIAGLVVRGGGDIALAAVFVGLMEGIAETTASILKLLSGRISDRIGKRKALVIVGYGLATVCRPLNALVNAVWQVITLKFFDRVGKGIRTSPRDALIGDSVGSEARGLAFSFHRAMDHTGAVLGPVVGVGILYALLGQVLWRGSAGSPSAAQMRALRWLFALSLVPGIPVMLTLVFRVREIRPRRGDDETIAPGGFRRLPRKLYYYVGIVTLFALGNSSDLFLIFLGRSRFGMSLLELIALWVALHVSKIVFSIPGGVVSDKVGRGPVIVAGWAVYAVVYLGLAFSGQLWQFWALIVVYGFYHGMTEGVEKAVVADFVPSALRATAYGVYHGAVGLAALPASLLFGVFWYALGAPLAFGIGAALAGVAAVLLLVLLSGTRRAAGGQAAT